MTETSRRNFLYLVASTLTYSSCAGVEKIIGSKPLEITVPKRIIPKHTDKGKAVIINGDQDEHPQGENPHMQNIVRAVKFLTGTGYGTEDITVLSAPYKAFLKRNVEELRSKSEYLGFKLPDIKGPATTKNVDAVLEKTLSEIVPGQELFIYITGHGYFQEESSYAVLNAPYPKDEFDKLFDSHLDDILTNGKYDKGVVIFDGCHGEGFAKMIGNERTTVITNKKIGEEAACAYFAFNFFNAPWRELADLDGNRRITLNEAARYTQKILNEWGVESSTLTLTGEYNPSLDLVKGAIDWPAGTFIVLPPNSGITQLVSHPTDMIMQKPNVINVSDEVTLRQATEDPHGRYYFQAKGCYGCDLLSPFIAETLAENRMENKLYVLSGEYDRKDHKVELSEEAKKVEAALGLEKERGIPKLIRREDSKIKMLQIGPPFIPYSYGNLPDKTIEIVDRERIKDILF